MFNRLSSLKKQKMKLEEDISVLTLKQRLLKTDSCDFCVVNAMKNIILSSECEKAKYYISLTSCSLKICEKHAKQLRDELISELNKNK